MDLSWELAALLGGIMNGFMSLPETVQWVFIIALGIGAAGWIAHIAETVPSKAKHPELVWATLALFMTVAFAATARWALGG